MTTHQQRASLVNVATRGVANGGERVTECIGPRGQWEVYWPSGTPGQPIRVMSLSPKWGRPPRYLALFIITAHVKPNTANTPKARSSATRCIRQPRGKAERDQSPAERWRTCAEPLPRFIRDKQRKLLDPGAQKALGLGGHDPIRPPHCLYERQHR